MAPKTIAILGFDGASTLDLTGPLEALATCSRVEGQREGRVCYRTMIVGLHRKVFYSDAGIAFRAESTLKSAPSYDTLIIPGGKTLLEPEVCRRAAIWLAIHAAPIRRIASVSTGIYALAESGLLDGRRVTTHWRFAREVAQRFPKLRVNYTASFLKDDSFYTCAGGASSLEMILAFIEEDYGSLMARAVAREMIMRLHPAEESHHYYDPVGYQSDPAERVADLPSWILAHLDRKLTVAALAERASLCRRHFTRVFRRVFHCTPADFVEELRLNEARRRLLSMRTTIEKVAEGIGFNSSDAFRRAFERRVGVSPTVFRYQANSPPVPRKNPPVRTPARQPRSGE